MANINVGRLGEIVRLCNLNGTDVTLVTELNTFIHGIKSFEIDGEVRTFYILRKHE